MATALVVEAMKEAADSVRRYKASAKFEDEIREAVCDAFVKGFECKRKMVRLFHLPDMHDVVPVDPEDNPVDAMPLDEATSALPVASGQAKSIKAAPPALPPAT